MGPLPTPTAPEPSGSGWPRPALLAVWVGSGCAVLVLLEALVVLGIAALALSLRVPSGVTAQGSAPRRVVVGRSFALRIQVSNRGSRSVVLQNVVARGGMVENLELSSPRPRARSTAPTLFGTQVWPFDVTLAPGDTWSVEFQARARRPGRLQGGLELQANNAPLPIRLGEIEVAAPKSRPPRR